ncbi:hypothetical protein DMENIID0001_008730 [Sergentomyia squamirostris]
MENFKSEWQDKFVSRYLGEEIDQVISNLEESSPIEDIVPDARFEVSTAGIKSTVASALNCYQGTFKTSVTDADVLNFETMTLLQFRAKVTLAQRKACSSGSRNLLTPFVTETVAVLNGTILPIAVMLAQVGLVVHEGQRYIPSSSPIMKCLNNETDGWVRSD